LVGATAASREPIFTIGREDAKCGVFEATVEVAANDFLSFFAFIGVDADAHEIPSCFDDLWIAELTVLRVGVARSEDTRNTAAL
jgi:hypothetical protein